MTVQVRSISFPEEFESFVLGLMYGNIFYPSYELKREAALKMYRQKYHLKLVIHEGPVLLLERFLLIVIWMKTLGRVAHDILELFP